MQEMHFKFNNKKRLKIKGLEKLNHAKSKQNKGGVAILTSDEKH